MEAILRAGNVEAVAIVEPQDEAAETALNLAPSAERVANLDDLLALDVDGVVIATPSAAHADQSIQALQAGAAVFCQKPLGRSGAEVQAVVDAARQADRLLAVDLSYRFTEAGRRVRGLVQEGALGPIHAVDLTFHNAYGPDKPWFYDRALSGGGCIMDLGVHLIDLALWILDGAQVTGVTSHLFAKGRPLGVQSAETEDFAVATLTLDSGAVVRLACSWKLHAGQEAIISTTVYGADGGAALRNLGGFYDFTAERYTGTSTETLASPPDDWGGRAAADWAARLRGDRRFDPAVGSMVAVANVIDRIYSACGSG
jgi:predicted dehydrogenase